MTVSSSFIYSANVCTPEMVVQGLLQWLECIIGDMLGHSYRITASAMVFCDVTPTGYSHTDDIVLYLTGLAKFVIWCRKKQGQV